MPNSNTTYGGNVHITFNPTTSSTNSTVTLSQPNTPYVNVSGSGAGNFYTMNTTPSTNASSYSTIYATPPSPYTFTNGAQPQMTVQGGGTFTGTIQAGDVEIDGVSLKDTMKAIQDRLAILVPDPKKLEKFAALKASYEHYLLLEKLCTENPPDET